MCIETLRNELIEPTLYFFNPNIHPLKEFKMRKNTLVDYAKSQGAKLILNNDYGLREFIKGVYPDFDNRCGYCYRTRLEATAKFAADNGYDTFTSTLFISPYQNHELMRTIAEAAALKYGVEFLYRDFRPFFKEGQQKARDMGLYMQKYCGCVFSEEDRYKKHKKKESPAESGTL